jgi:hypothetical protein
MMPPKSFLIAGALALGGIGLGTLAGLRGEPTTFGTRWQDVPEQQAPLQKRDRLALARVVQTETMPLLWLPVTVKTETVPLAVLKTETIAVEPDAHARAEIAIEKTVREKIVREKKPVRDICERHGMRKVTIRNGRSWRCRKPGRN